MRLFLTCHLPQCDNCLCIPPETNGIGNEKIDIGELEDIILELSLPQSPPMHGSLDGEMVGGQHCIIVMKSKNRKNT